jgi:hypothetical protein
MSLTSELDDRNSRLSRFMATRLPDLGALRKAHRADRPMVDVVKPSPPAGTRIQYGTLGAAIDHRLRYALSARVQRDGAPGHGIELSAFVTPTPARTALYQAGLELLDELERFLAAASPDNRGHGSRCRPQQWTTSRSGSDPVATRTLRGCVRVLLAGSWSRVAWLSGRCPAANSVSKARTSLRRSQPSTVSARSTPAKAWFRACSSARTWPVAGSDSNCWSRPWR